MTILLRARDIILNPKETWAEIKAEDLAVKQIIINYAAPLALIPAVAQLIGRTFFGVPLAGIPKTPFLSALLEGVVVYFIALAALFIGAWIVKMLAPFFGSDNSYRAAMALEVYSSTPVWLAGACFVVLPLLPLLGLVVIASAFYSLYLFVLGFPAMLKTPKGKIFLYVISVIVLTMGFSILFQFVLNKVFGFMGLPIMTV